MIEYRLCWSASSNITFRGSTNWAEWGGFEETEEDVEKALNDDHGTIAQGFEEVLEACGFEWWAETRVAESSDAA